MSAEATPKSCPTCGAEVFGAKCPSCASTLKQTSTPAAAKPSRSSTIVSSLVIFGLVIWFISYEGEPAVPKSPEEVRKDQIELQFSGFSGAHRGVERLIKQAMNDPDSYEHDATRYVDNGTTLTVSTAYRGRNGFGGMVRNTVVATVDLNGNVLEIISE